MTPMLTTLFIAETFLTAPGYQVAAVILAIGLGLAAIVMALNQGE